MRTTGLTAALLALLVAITCAPTVNARPSPTGQGSGWTSFFRDGPLKDSGWPDCAAPIGVSIDDTSKFPPKVASKIALALTNAVQLWSTSTPLSFEFSGLVPMQHDSDSGVTSPTDGIKRKRHLYIAFVTDAQSRALTKSIVGLGLPTRVDPANRSILLAEATFERDYVEKATVNEVTALFTHEMGHALGLGHSADRRDIMYPLVGSATRLGPGDIEGLLTLTRPCLDDSASRDYPQP